MTRDSAPGKSNDSRLDSRLGTCDSGLDSRLDSHDSCTDLKTKQNAAVWFERKDSDDCISASRF